MSYSITFRFAGPPVGRRSLLCRKKRRDHGVRSDSYSGTVKVSAWADPRWRTGKSAGEAARYPCPDFPESSSCSNRAGSDLPESGGAQLGAGALQVAQLASDPAEQADGRGRATGRSGSRCSRSAGENPRVDRAPRLLAAPSGDRAADGGGERVFFHRRELARVPARPGRGTRAIPCAGARRHRAAPSGNRQPPSKASHDRSVPLPLRGAAPPRAPQGLTVDSRVGTLGKASHDRSVPLPHGRHRRVRPGLR